MRQDVTNVVTEVKEVERAPKHPKVYSKIHIAFTITGKNLKREKVEEAVDLSQNKYCSVSAMLKRSADITYSIEIIDEQ